MSVRVDKWLWSVRLFKTRSIATDACKGGKVSMDGKVVKASKEVKVGDIIEVQKDLLHMTVKVLQESSKRMGAPLVANFMLDLTPEEEFARVESIRNNGFEFRQRGAGRPTKRDRRYLNFLKNK